MSLRYGTLLICLTTLIGCAASLRTPGSPANGAPLIDRAELLGSVGRQMTRISPDGRWLSWLAPHEGVINLWVAPVTNPGAAESVTHETTDRVSNYVWAPGGDYLLYTQDPGGSQRSVIYRIALRDSPARAMTPTQNTTASIVAVSTRVKDRVLVSVNSRNARWPDLYSLDVATGELKLLLENDGYSRVLVDPMLEVRAVLKARGDGGSDLYAVEAGRIASSPFESIPFDDVRTTAPLGYSPDGHLLYWRDSRGRNTAALIAQDLRNGRKTVLGSHPGADVIATTTNPRTGLIDAYEVNPLRSEWTGLTPQTRLDVKRLARRLGSDFEISSRADADDRWVVLLESGDRPPRSYLYDRKAENLTALPDDAAVSGNTPFGHKHAVAIRSRDGLVQAAYITLPFGSDRDGDGRPDAPLPLVVLVHGGPWERTDLGYDPTAVFLANRGYAVLSPNFRGSTGFGKKHVSAADGEWGRKMQDDLVDAVDWAVARGIARRDKVAIYGGSYGGYAVLAALAFNAETFACGVDLFGPSNLRTQVESDAARNPFRREEYFRRMGDPTTAAGRASLAERSPLFHAAAIHGPLLVAHGSNDPQVSQAHSDQLVEALKASDTQVTYLVFSGEGHGFSRPANVIALRAVTEHFLARCLGGRAQAFGRSLRSSSLLVPHGAEFIEGLPEAIAQ